MWTKDQIKKHREAARRLILIKDQIFGYLKKNPGVTEERVHRYILKKYKEFGLATDLDLAIVAFGQNTANVHHYPGKGSGRLEKNSLVMLDLWARLDRPRAPFADITWMGFYGDKIPARMQKIFNLVKAARDKSLLYIKNELKKGRLSTGAKVDAAARGYIARQGFGKRFLHNTGHCLGLNSPHGDGPGFTRLNHKSILKNLGYTIEPGIYLKTQFGVRSEIDFYIDSRNQLVITTDVQEEIVIIK